MTKQISFTKYEHRVLPNFRKKINKAESTEDVKKFFIQTAKELFEDIFGEEMRFGHEDITLQMDSDPSYTLSNRVLSSENIMSVWNESDLSRVVLRLAESAMRRYKHLEKNPEKSETKIRV